MPTIAARVILFFIILSCAWLLPQAVRADDWGTAALVNGQPITEQAFGGELRRLERQGAGKKGGSAASSVLKRQALENLVVREVLFQEAKRCGVLVSPEEVGGELARLREQLPQDAVLESTLDRMGVEQGVFEDQLSKAMAIRKLMEIEFGSKSRVAGEEVAHYYEEHSDEFKQPLRFRLSHILVKTGPDANQARKREARARIEGIRSRLTAGEDFAKLAKEASDCYSARSGGDLGHFSPGQLARTLEDEALALKPGGVSGVVEDRYGFHLLKLTELQLASVPPLAAVEAKIRQDLARQKESRALAPMLRRLRAEAKVEILLSGDRE